MKTERVFLDMTPTWAQILPILILSIREGNAQGREVAIKELARMADAADAYNAQVRAQQSADEVAE